eukprot:GHVU01109782.1.p1 GENE.GHVU01109782.1~~GHVU01109782.1.p1  ORF type:complete len:163 (-),score=0.86 GHVU01109782.1:927-1415(-)
MIHKCVGKDLPLYLSVNLCNRVKRFCFGLCKVRLRSLCLSTVSRDDCGRCCFMFSLSLLPRGFPVVFVSCFRCRQFPISTVLGGNGVVHEAIIAVKDIDEYVHAVQETLKDLYLPSRATVAHNIGESTLPKQGRVVVELLPGKKEAERDVVMSYSLPTRSSF